MKKAILIIFCSMSIVFHAQLKVGKQPKVIQSNTQAQKIEELMKRLEALEAKMK
jgi:hypothetical protein